SAFSSVRYTRSSFLTHVLLVALLGTALPHHLPRQYHVDTLSPVNDLIAQVTTCCAGHGGGCPGCSGGSMNCCDNTLSPDPSWRCAAVAPNVLASTTTTQCSFLPGQQSGLDTAYLAGLRNLP